MKRWKVTIDYTFSATSESEPVTGSKVYQIKESDAFDAARTGLENLFVDLYAGTHAEPETAFFSSLDVKSQEIR